MRASLIGAGLFAIVAVGCSGSKGDNLFGPGGAEITGGGGSSAGDDGSSPGGGGSSLTGTGGGGIGGSSTGGGGSGAAPGTGGAGGGGTGGAIGTGGAGTGGAVVRPDAGPGGMGRPDAAPDAAPPPVDAAPDVGGGVNVVACGNNSCTVNVQQCCETNNPTCVGLNAGGGQCPVNAPRLRCDDGSDCPGAQVCCASPAGVAGNNTDLARCTQLANCPQNNSQILCDPADPAACPRQGTQCSVTQQAIFPNRPFCN